jgi:hypothetical protein
MVIKTPAQVERCKPFHHLPETFRNRFVETVQRLDFSYALRIDALPSAIG